MYKGLLGDFGHELQLASSILRSLRYFQPEKGQRIPFHGLLMIASILLGGLFFEKELLGGGFPMDFGGRALRGLFTRWR